MRILDLILLGILIIITFYGWKKGIVASLLSLAGIIISFVLAGLYAPMFQNALVNNFGLGSGMSMFLAYLLVIIIILLIIQIIRLLLEGILKLLHLTIVNRILGAMFAFINGVLLFVVLLTLIEITPAQKKFVKSTEGSVFITSVREVKNELMTLLNKQDIKFIQKTKKKGKAI
ncbi:MAG: CvpA family protein [Candidatus Zophobacter franzmannii]|jgi:membrane protein required for colicin V production|nr:CvpA family protein [Candidatus Zophobacter franzmannii]